MTRSIPIYLERGEKRIFATAVDWPGWSRSAKTEEAAIQALFDYRNRYAAVAGSGFRPPETVADLEVVGRLTGGSGTDFGVPGEAPREDAQPFDDAELDRHITLLRAAWKALDRAADRARGHELRKGPRGGGRDLDKILDHVSEAERAYIGQLGSHSPAKASARELRTLAVEVLRARVHDKPLADPRNTRKPWSPRYFVRRGVWHVLDHAWEIEDRIED